MSEKNRSTAHKFQIGYKKLKKLDLAKMEEQYNGSDPDIDYNPFRISNLQAYNPIYNRFFQMDETNYNMITLNNKFLAYDMKTVYYDNTKIEKNIHIKFSPILNPLHFLIGKYDLNNENYKTLPKYNSDTSSCLAKIIDMNNSSYTDAFFSYLSSMLSETHAWTPGVEYYGSYLGVQQKFKLDIMDDFSYVNDTSFFLDNIGKRFEIDENIKILLNSNPSAGSRNNRMKINITDELDNIDLEIDTLNIVSEPESVVNNETPVLVEDLLVQNDQNIELNTYNDVDDEDDEDDDDSKESNSEEEDDEEGDDDEEEEEDDDDEEGDEEGDDDDDEELWETTTSSSSSQSSFQEEQKLFCYLHEFPVQLIFQEKCKDTLDSLLMSREISEESLTSALFQIIMILITYQKAFDFTHNDLHTNNIMFIDTDEPYLYYKFENIIYKVPTFGRIFKMIDFGRAIYRFNNKIFCSDSFAPGNDAHTQYNCEPYMNENKPRIDPNPSFDLTRLGCSIYDFIFDDPEPETFVSEIHKIIYDWCTDDNNKSVVYKKTGQERYPGFKLYKMIARTVHKHVPKDQLKRPLFSAYAVSTAEMNSHIINIDAIPRYISSDK